MAGVELIWRLRQAKPDDAFPSLTFTLQTLLARHEAYMASAERDRLELTTRIEQLEHENAELETRNKSITDDNTSLRDELEQLNDSVKDAEAKIGLLEATLLDSQREVRRLELAADRAATLERQIAILEEEQLVLRTTIARTEEEARTAMYRWRQAEKGLNDVQEQLERMEKESREERERHVEVIGRMERQRAMEKELSTAAGRLKGAAAAKSMTDSKNGGNVVSHFVRDLLQDNANLQVGMAELREMLLSANDEIQMLREQLMYHQPATGHESNSPATLHAELVKQEPPTPPPQPPRVSQELHVHHHYHVTHKPDARRPRKRRQGLTAGVFTPPVFSAPASPVTSSARFQRGSLAGPLMSPPAHTHDAGLPPTNRWSLQTEDHTEYIASPAPSSPRSNRDSVFDRVPDLPSPASPATSVDPTSPGWRAVHRKKVSEFSLRSISETAMFPAETSSVPAGYPPRPHPLTRLIMSGNPIPEITSYTTDDVPNNTSPSLAGYTDYDSTADAGADDTLSPTSSLFDPSVEQRPRGLRRVISHESIMSLSNGLDIHTLKARPSQLALKPLGLSAAGTNVSAVTAQPTLSSGSPGGKRGSVILRDSIAQTLPLPKTRQSGGRVVSTPARGRGRDPDRGQSSSRAPSALGKLVSWRPWGAPGSSNTTAAAAGPASPETRKFCVTGDHRVDDDNYYNYQVRSIDSISLGSVSVSVSRDRDSDRQRGAGGHPGAVPGFWAAQRKRGAPSKVAVEEGVREGVREAMREVFEDV
ncbi:hypothetical protein NEMBOFW57_009087 [Staphylotrichum longicolle]|uniref:Uncharacterized protein n=1 Tax=Staphylotrichum longicolle TaxID=669026 RepID=A0AAD4HX85_9PEZI|nr:hypothetical protein NEMBOFW57_009087 [Staphylotrichum longicolle]